MKQPNPTNITNLLNEFILKNGYTINNNDNIHINPITNKLMHVRISVFGEDYVVTKYYITLTFINLNEYNIMENRKTRIWNAEREILILKQSPHLKEIPITHQNTYYYYNPQTKEVFKRMNSQGRIQKCDNLLEEVETHNDVKKNRSNEWGTKMIL